MKTPTLWVTTAQLPTYPALSKDIKAEVAIVGGGLTGLLSAYVLGKAGKKVAVIEKETIAEGATHLTTAFLTASLDTDPSKLIETFGVEHARKIVTSHMTAIDFIESIITEEQIDCDFMRCPNYIYAHKDEEFGTLLGEFDSVKQLGITANISGDPLHGFRNYGYIEMANQAKFHPLKFLRGLLHAMKKYDVQIFEKTEAKDIKESTQTVITKDKKKIQAEWILATTYEPFGQPLGLFFKKGMYQTYILEAHIPQNTIREGTYEDTMNPYHYFRIDPAPTYDTVIIGGEDHRTDIPIDTERCFEDLEEYLRDILDDREYTVTNRWDGPILEPSDGLALIGPHKHPNIMYAFGFSGNGMTYAGISALIFKDLIVNKKETELYDMYRASRILGARSLFTKAIDYGGEFVHGAAKKVVSGAADTTKKVFKGATETTGKVFKGAAGATKKVFGRKKQSSK
jgi:glycine/D-amino acid oxidase-like deaminating enzyme